MVQNKACECKIELNHLNSMMLMLMEALADRRWKDAKFYEDVVEDTIKDVAKCAGIDPRIPLSYLENTDKYIDMKEEGIRLTLRTLEDAFWHTIAKVCE